MFARMMNLSFKYHDQNDNKEQFSSADILFIQLPLGDDCTWEKFALGEV